MARLQPDAGHAAGKARRSWTESVLMLRWLQDRTLRVSQVALNGAVAACVRGQQWTLSLEQLQGIRQLGVEANEVACSAAMGGRNWRISLSLLRQMRGFSCEPNLITWNTLITSCEKGGQWALAGQFFELIRSRGCTPNIVSYGAGIASWGRGQEWQLALKLLGLLREASIETSAIAVNSAISAASGGSSDDKLSQKASSPNLRWALALALGAELGTAGIPSTSVTLGSLVSACRHNAQWERGLLLLRQRPRGNSKSDGCAAVATFNSAITACEKSIQWRWALQLVSEMRSCRLPPDPISAGACISACEKAWQWCWALHLLRERFTGCVFGTEGDTTTGHSLVVAISAAASACEKGRNWRWALALAEDLRTRSLNGLRPSCPMTHNAVINALGHAARWESVLELWATMGRKNLEPSMASVNAAISSLGAAQQWQAATEVWVELGHLDLLPSASTTATSLSSGLAARNALISGCAEAMRWRQALLMLAATQTPDVVTFNACAEVFEKSRRWGDALGLLTWLRSNGLQPTTVSFNSLLSACVGPTGSWRIAWELLRGMHETSHCMPDLVTYGALLRSCDWPQ
ncbi:unnamed protein product, partial [Polarella glacialis]